MEKTELKPNFWTMFLYFLVCAAFVVGAIFIINSDANQKTKILGGYMGLILFGLGGIVFFYKAVIRKPTLTIDSEGIYPNFLRQSIRQLIPWKEISKIGIARQTISTYRATVKEKYLVIYLKNPDNFNFNKTITKEGAEKFASYLGNTLIMKGDLYISLRLLPKEDILFPIIRQCKVKFDETLEDMSSQE